MSRTLGVWAKKQEVYLAFADDGVPRDEEPQRIEAPSIMEASERLGGFLTSFRHALDDVAPEAVRILQPEQIYQASYSEFAPKLALETAVRLVGDERHVPVEVLHRAQARPLLGFSPKGPLDSHFEQNIEPRKPTYAILRSLGGGNVGVAGSSPALAIIVVSESSRRIERSELRRGATFEHERGEQRCGRRGERHAEHPVPRGEVGAFETGERADQRQPVRRGRA